MTDDITLEERVRRLEEQVSDLASRLADFIVGNEMWDGR